MKTLQLTLAEWRYLFNPLTAFPSVLIGYTFLELIFLGAIKFETTKAPYHGPRDPNVKSILNYISKGENFHQLTYQIHQKVFIDDLNMIEKSTLGEYLKRLSLVLGKDQGYVFNRDYLKIQLQDRGILKLRNIILNTLVSQRSEIRTAKKIIKKDLDELKELALNSEQIPAYLERLGPLVYLGDIELSQKLNGVKYLRKEVVENSYYDDNINSEVLESSELYYQYPNITVKVLLEKFKKYFPLVSINYG